MKRTRITLAAAVLATLAAAVGAPADATPTPPPAALRSPSPSTDAYTAYDLGIQGRPSDVGGRDAGYSALIGETSLWAYGDTFDTVGTEFHSNTGALDVQGFLPTREPVESTGFSADQLVPFTSGEASYNASHMPPDRYWVWPTGIVARPAPQTSLVFWWRQLQGGATTTGAVGLADIEEGETVASRRAALFGGNDCAWGAPLLAQDGYVYLYATMDAPTAADRTACPNGGTYASLDRMVARAPLSQSGTRSAYRFWDGSAWSTDPLDAVDVMDIWTADVTYSPALGQYLAIGGLGNSSSYSTAPAPQGPWSAPAPWITPHSSPGTYGNYAWINHPEHASADDGVLLVSYHRSLSDETGDIRLLAVDLRPNPNTERDAYITRMFQEFLGRNPLSTDLTYWRPRLEGRTVTVPTFTRTLARSDEGLRHVVEETYVEVLGRSASSSEEAYWAGEMDTHDWGHDTLVAKVASAPELSDAYPVDGDYVDAVFPRTLGRPASATDRTYWGGQLAGGMSRYTFVRSLMLSDEGGRHQAQLAYQDILGRPATTTQQAAVSGHVREAIEIRYKVAATAEAIGV